MGDLKQEEDLRKASSGKIEINQVLNQDNILAKSKNAKTVIKNEISRYATQKGKKNDDNHVENGDASVTFDDFDSKDVLMIPNMNSVCEWVMDSDCSFHKTPNKS